MKRSSIIWGVIFILVGTLILLRSFDIIQFSWWSFWRLWPVILILIGVSLIPVKDWIKTTISIIILVGSFLFIITTYNHEETFCTKFNNNWKDIKAEIKNNNLTSSNSATFPDSVTTVNLDIEIPECKDFSTKSHNQSGVLLETVGITVFNLSTKTTDNIANCTLNPVFPDTDIKEANLFLTESLIYTMNVQSKSKRNYLDFSNVNISELNFTAVEYNKTWDIKLGEKFSPVKVNLVTNNDVKEIILTIPESVGIKFSTPDINEIDNWNNLNRKGDCFFSENYETAQVKIEINVDQVQNSSFTFIQY